MREALERYGIKDTGPIEDENLYVINDNATFKKTSSIMKNIRQRIANNPDKNYLVVYVLAGHGMIAAGKQVMLLNEFNKSTGFYKFWGIEGEVRGIAQKHPNSY